MEWPFERAPVRLAGVDIGRVKSVRVHPERKEEPVEIVMDLSTPYELKIPNDSTASLETAGLLGETFVEIDCTMASGPPVQQNAILKSKRTNSLSSEQVIEKVGEIVTRKGCDCEKTRQPNTK
jgi:phospholipid/cholesterol/gamma-HCH transport system substrate-binding protein